jgi:hypothetical protein
MRQSTCSRLRAIDLCERYTLSSAKLPIMDFAAFAKYTFDNFLITHIIHHTSHNLSLSISISQSHLLTLSSALTCACCRWGPNSIKSTPSKTPSNSYRGTLAFYLYHAYRLLINIRCVHLRKLQLYNVDLMTDASLAPILSNCLCLNHLRLSVKEPSMHITDRSVSLISNLQRLQGKHGRRETDICIHPIITVHAHRPWQ